MNWLSSLIERLLSIVPRIQMVNPDELGVRIILGKYVKSLVSGWYLVWPVLMEVQIIAVTPQVVDARCQSVRTKDGIDLAIGLAVRYRINNVAPTLLKVLDYDRSLQNSALVACVEIIGDMDMSEIHVDPINVKLTDLVQKKARGWGIEVQNCGVTDIGKTTNIRILGNTPVVPITGDEE